MNWNLSILTQHNHMWTALGLNPASHFLSYITTIIIINHFHYRDKCGKNNTANEKIKEHTMLKENLKRKVNVAHKSVQTEKEEEKLLINTVDLTSDGML